MTEVDLSKRYKFYVDEDLIIRVEERKLHDNSVNVNNVIKLVKDRQRLKWIAYWMNKYEWR